MSTDQEILDYTECERKDLNVNLVKKDFLIDFSELENCHQLENLEIIFHKLYKGIEIPGEHMTIRELEKFTNLKTLTLNIGILTFGDRLEEEPHIYLSQLKKCSKLRKLILILNDVDRKKYLKLEQLKECHQIEDITLDLKNVYGTHDGDCGDDGIFGISQLKECKNLQFLNIDLEFNRIKDKGVIALCQLKECPKLRELTLNLKKNYISDEAINQLKEIEEFLTKINIEIPHF